MPDAAGGRVDQHRLARPQPGQVDQPVVGGEEHDRHAARLRERPARRASARPCGASVDRRPGRTPPANRPITRSPARQVGDAGADLEDHAGALAAERPASPGYMPSAISTSRKFRPGGADRDPDLPRRQRRGRSGHAGRAPGRRARRWRRAASRPPRAGGRQRRRRRPAPAGGASSRPPRTATCGSPAASGGGQRPARRRPSPSRSTSTNRPGFSDCAERTRPHTGARRPGPATSSPCADGHRAAGDERPAATPATRSSASHCLRARSGPRRVSVAPPRGASVAGEPATSVDADGARRRRRSATRSASVRRRAPSTAHAARRRAASAAASGSSRRGTASGPPTGGAAGRDARRTSAVDRERPAAPASSIARRPRCRRRSAGCHAHPQRGRRRRRAGARRSRRTAATHRRRPRGRRSATACSAASSSAGCRPKPAGVVARLVGQRDLGEDLVAAAPGRAQALERRAVVVAGVGAAVVEVVDVDRLGAGRRPRASRSASAGRVAGGEHARWRAASTARPRPRRPAGVARPPARRPLSSGAPTADLERDAAPSSGSTSGASQGQLVDAGRSPTSSPARQGQLDERRCRAAARCRHRVVGQPRVRGQRQPAGEQHAVAVGDRRRRRPAAGARRRPGPAPAASPARRPPQPVALALEGVGGQVDASAPPARAAAPSRP